MSLFKKKALVLELKGELIGEFDPEADGFYRNVAPFQIDARKNRVLRISMRADGPVDIAVADGSGALVAHKGRVSEASLDVPTARGGHMSVIFGVFPGERAVIDAEAWMV